jgi:hypothetical protein
LVPISRNGEGIGLEGTDRLGEYAEALEKADSMGNRSRDKSHNTSITMMEVTSQNINTSPVGEGIVQVEDQFQSVFHPTKDRKSKDSIVPRFCKTYRAIAKQMGTL